MILSKADLEEIRGYMDYALDELEDPERYPEHQVGFAVRRKLEPLEGALGLIGRPEDADTLRTYLFGLETEQRVRFLHHVEICLFCGQDERKAGGRPGSNPLCDCVKGWVEGHY